MNGLGFNVGDLSEDAPDDIEGLDAATTQVANLLSTEPPPENKFLFQHY
ncbi:acyl-protein thioesterase 2-like [Senna tora]|uniref:Acyl-protein thioesterase 2-like n=1 Tax=Senna tora TaxID=362788 RepID=A0A834SRV7_9FABA|nr:acyl-protein thioesterase 2-like [Senna tora]